MEEVRTCHSKTRCSGVGSSRPGKLLSSGFFITSRLKSIGTPFTHWLSLATNTAPLWGLAAIILLILGFATALRAESLPPENGGISSRHETSRLNNLQSLIESAQWGDTITISGGTYSGNLLINKRLALIGVGKPILRGEDQGSVITITADSCVVQGFIVEHCGSMLVEENAGILVKSNHNIIAQNDLRDILFGIYLLHAERNSILNNTIVGRRHLEVGERGSGIHIWNSQHNRFSGNSITDVRDGFYIQNASHSWIERNEAHNVRYGVHYMYADSNTFLRNRFTDNVAGAAIMYSTGIRMRHNVFSHNRGFSSFGILFQDCHGLIADSNVVADNVVGMFFESSTDNVFRNNVIAQNDVALQMFQNSINNSFTENNFVDNLSPLTIVGKRTETHWNEGGRGNYWSSYDGYDLDGNGIGDTPMKIQNVFQYLEGQNANVRLYLYSPASQALAVAASAFPIININEEADNKPLMRQVDLHAAPAVESLKSAGEAHVDASVSSHAWLAFPFLGLIVIGIAYRTISRSLMQQ